MCGIAGILHFDSLGMVDRDRLRTMNSTLFHRGPDDEGFFVDGQVGLAMRRLSIIDLTSGHQPVYNEDKSMAIVFNGEIYNYRDLSAVLRTKGHEFYTASDTETIIHLYEEYGEECVRHLRGMFAFAIWDRRTRTLLLARDRLGIKPLYYSIHGGRLIFGSELKAVLADPDVPREIDPQGLVAYLQYGYVPDPLTILKTVRKLPPGHLLIVRRGQVEIKAYWDVLSFFASSQEPKSEDNCEVELGNYLWEAVRLRLISDVPVGAFLSGGVDSSMVVALMARSLDHPVKTFSIGFKEEAFNELPYAREVAQHLGTDHHELMLDPERVDVIEKIVWHFDEPFGDPSALPTYFVSKLARESVKVILSGDGGDELFGGYDRYVEHLRRGFADHIPSPIKLWMLKPLSRVLREGVPGKRFLYNLSLPPLERYLDSVSHFPPRLLRGLLSPDVLTELTGNGDSDSTKPIMSLQTAEMLSQIQAVDFKTYLPGDILVKVDRMSMAHSVEARVPLLDHKLVEYAVGLPASMKVRAEVSKYLFKRIARRFLPDSIINRKKQGFGVPLQKWFKEDLKAFLWDILGDPTARGRSYFVRNGPISLLKHQRRESESTRLWMLAMLELWHRVVLDR